MISFVVQVEQTRPFCFSRLKCRTSCFIPLPMWLHMPELKPVRYEIPISEDLIDELFPFWASIFGEVLPDIGREVFLGAEGPTAIARSTCTERVNDWPAPALPCIRRPCRLWRDSARLPRTPGCAGGALPRNCFARRWRIFALPAARLFCWGLSIQPQRASTTDSGGGSWLGQR